MPVLLPQIASYLSAALLLFLTLHLQLVAALFAGMIVYTLIDKLAPFTANAFHANSARLIATIIVASVIVTAVSGAAFALYAFLKNSGTSGLPQLWEKLADIIEGANAILPPWLLDYLPDSADQLRTVLANWLHGHSAELQGLGKQAGLALVHILIGGIIGAMVAVSSQQNPLDHRPLARLLHQRVGLFYQSFERVVIGQGKISIINTLLTSLYLVVILPLAGIHLPFVKTMLVITLLVGILPVVGNLISNFVIIVVSASVSFNAALASLAFLVVLHKGEYFLSAKILGHQISAKAWEMLLAMLVMEAAFGVPGIALAPVLYAYLKGELRAKELI